MKTSMRARDTLACLGVLLVPALAAAAPPAEKIRNDKVVVVEQLLAPGETESRTSAGPGIVLCLDAGSLLVTDAGGRTSTRTVRRGEGLYDARAARTVKNGGASPLRILRVEYLGPGAADTWGATGLSPNYTVVAEDRHARIYDIKIAVGGREPQHTHRDRIVVCLSGAQLQHVMPDGRKETSSMETDQAVWRRGGTHVGENVGTTRFWAIAIEPK